MMDSTLIDRWDHPMSSPGLQVIVSKVEEITKKGDSGMETLILSPSAYRKGQACLRTSRSKLPLDAVNQINLSAWSSRTYPLWSTSRGFKTAMISRVDLPFLPIRDRQSAWYRFRCFQRTACGKDGCLYRTKGYRPHHTERLQSKSVRELAQAQMESGQSNVVVVGDGGKLMPVSLEEGRFCHSFQSRSPYWGNTPGRGHNKKRS